MKSYPVGLAGESNCQAAIRQCLKGEDVRIVHEPDNPYDSLALKVLSAGGDTIGYIPKASWLRNAIHEEGSGAQAAIKSIERAGKYLGVVIDVVLTEDGIDVENVPQATRSAAPPSGPSAGCVIALLALAFVAACKLLS